MNGFANNEFTLFASSKAKNKKDVGLCKLTSKDFFPYLIVEKNGIDFLITPICFSGPLIFCNKKDLEIINNQFKNINGGFIQTRELYEGEQKFGNTSKYMFNIDTRTNYRLDLNIPMETFLANMNSSSRRYSIKFLKVENNFQIIKVENDQEKLIKIFSKLYFDNSQNLNFSSSYVFYHQNWKNLLMNDSFTLLLLFYKESIISGTIITKLKNSFDLTFTVNNKNFNNAGKATILYLFKYLRKKDSGFFDLGGGVIEDDGLTKLKSGMGGYPVFFKRLRFIHSDLFKGKMKDKFLNLNKRWP